MAVSYSEAREACLTHYLERGMTAEYWSEYIGKKPEQVFRIYNNIQEEQERAKHIGIRPLPPIGDFQACETYWIDEPAGSQE